MVFILPFVFGAFGMAVGAVGESYRQAAKHHRTVAQP